MTLKELDDIGKTIVDAAYTVHRALGPGLLESVYTAALMHEMILRGLDVKKQVGVKLFFKGCDLGKAYEIDLLVQNEIIVEIKSVIEMHPVFLSQILTYLKLRDNKLGYLINFNVTLIKDGIKRIVWNY